MNDKDDMNKQIKIQPKSSIAYVNIVKELKNKNMEFHTYKAKQERSFKVIFKYIHVTKNLDDIKEEIEDLRHTITNIWNIKKQGIKKALYMFYVELKPKSKDIYEVDSFFNCRVKFEPPYPKREILQCINCQRSYKKLWLS